MKKNLIIYDGVCLFCEGWVKFVLKNTRREYENYFIPLQYVNFNSFINEKVKSNASIILLDDKGDLYFHSDASLKVMLSLKFIYSYLAFFSLFIPKIFRNFIYNIIGKYRYHIWGKRDYCKLPDPKFSKYFPLKENDIPDTIIHKFLKNFSWNK